MANELMLEADEQPAVKRLMQLDVPFPEPTESDFERIKARLTEKGLTNESDQTNQTVDG